MGDAPLANAGAERVQAPKTHLSILPTWRPEDGAPTTTAVTGLSGGQAVGRAAGNSGQPGEESRRGGRGQEPPCLGTTGAGGVVIPVRGSQSRTAGVHPQARYGRIPPAGHPDHARPRFANPRPVRTRTGMGSEVRA